MKGRKSIRLREYDYSWAGAYFVTICTKERARLFGQVKGETMVLNEVGSIAQACWHEIPSHFEDVQVDEFVVMPDHIHGIVVIVDQVKPEREPGVGKNLSGGWKISGGVQLNAPTGGGLSSPTVERRLKSPTGGGLSSPTGGGLSSPTVGRRLKSPTTVGGGRKDYFSSLSPHRGTLGVIIRTYKAAVTMICRRDGHSEFGWQRGYYDHIIRNEASLSRIRQYIASNPQRWSLEKDWKDHRPS